MDANVISGVYITPLKQIYHPKGNVFHAMKCTDLGFDGFGETYFSSIKSGLIKAWKCHSRMTLNLVCIVGEIHFILYDERENSSTFQCFMEVQLSPQRESSYCRLTIPPGVWMGFVGIGEGENILLNIANIPHDPQEQANIPIEESNIVFDFNKILDSK